MNLHDITCVSKQLRLSSLRRCLYDVTRFSEQNESISEVSKRLYLALPSLKIFHELHNSLHRNEFK
jgi:hypothetical protein